MPFFTQRVDTGIRNLFYIFGLGFTASSHCLCVAVPVYVLHIISQRVWPAGSGTPRPVLQTGRADGHEAPDIRTEELEQRHLPAAGGGSEAQRFHRSHLQSDAADRHVDGTPANAQEFRPKGKRRGRDIRENQRVKKSVFMSDIPPLPDVPGASPILIAAP